MENEFEITIKGCNLLVERVADMLFVRHVKTSRQRKYREIEDFYNEANGIEVNSVDSMLRYFGRSDESTEDRFNKNCDLVRRLGFDRKDIVDGYRGALLRYVENMEIR